MNEVVYNPIYQESINQDRQIHQQQTRGRSGSNDAVSDIRFNRDVTGRVNGPPRPHSRTQRRRARTGGRGRSRARGRGRSRARGRSRSRY